MEVLKEKLEGNKVELKVKVEVEKVNGALNQAYKKIVKDVTIPGFRKGKVPRKILEAHYGKEVLYNDAFDFLVPSAYSLAVDEADIEPIDQPEITEFNIAQDEAATFTALVQVKPEVKLGDYTELGIDKKEVELNDEDVEKQVESLREQHSHLHNSDKETLEEGDFAVIDFEGYIDGEKFPGGTAEEYTLELGSGTFIPGFEEQLAGKKVGEETEVNVTFPEDYNAENLAGKDVVFKVNIKEIKEKHVPELNDDFVKEVSDFDTLDEFKDDIHSRLKKQREEKAQNEYEDAIIEAVTDNAEVEVPEVLVKNELDMMYQNLAYSLSRQGLKINDYFEHLGYDENSWREENSEEATRRAKMNLVLESIGKKEGIEVTDEEIDNRIEEMAEGSERKPEDIKTLLQIQGQLDGLFHSMMVQKVLNFLVENN